MVWVYFHSNVKEYNRVECWGPLEEAAKVLHRKLILCCSVHLLILLLHNQNTCHIIIQDITNKQISTL